MYILVIVAPVYEGHSMLLITWMARKFLLTVLIRCFVHGVAYIARFLCRSNSVLDSNLLQCLIMHCAKLLSTGVFYNPVPNSQQYIYRYFFNNTDTSWCASVGAMPLRTVRHSPTSCSSWKISTRSASACLSIWCQLGLTTTEKMVNIHSNHITW